MRVLLASLPAWFAMVLVGCASPTPPPPSQPDQVAPPPLSCGANTSLTCTSTKFCPINVSRNPDGSWTVFPYNLNVQNPNVLIIWTLTDGSRFDSDSAKKHGIRLVVGGAGQFSGGTPTDDLGATPAPKPTGSRYAVRFANSGPTSRNIEYHLAFEDASGTRQVVCDPLINNSGID